MMFSSQQPGDGFCHFLETFLFYDRETSPDLGNVLHERACAIIFLTCVNSTDSAHASRLPTQSFTGRFHQAQKLFLLPNLLKSSGVPWLQGSRATRCCYYNVLCEHAERVYCIFPQSLIKSHKHTHLGSQASVSVFTHSSSGWRPATCAHP